jgi:hypothetical protein
MRDTQNHKGSVRPGDIGWIIALNLTGGTQLLTGGRTSGGLTRQDGLTQITLESAGHVVPECLVSNLNGTYAADISGTATASVGGHTYLYTTSATGNGTST